MPTYHAPQILHSLRGPNLLPSAWLPRQPHILCSGCHCSTRSIDSATQLTTHLRIRLNLEPTTAQMTLATKRIDGRGIVVANFLLLCVVSHSHANMIVACSTVAHGSILRCQTRETSMYIPPDVEWKFKTGDKNSLVYLSCSISECMFACTAISMALLLSGVAVPTSIGIEASVLLAVIIRWVVLVETYANT